MQLALSSRSHQRGWQSRGVAELSFCTSVCPCVGRSELSSTPAWLFEHLLRSTTENQTDTLLNHATITICNLEKHLQGFQKKNFVITKSTLITNSCFVFELISNTTCWCSGIFGLSANRRSSACLSVHNNVHYTHKLQHFPLVVAQSQKAIRHFTTMLYYSRQD